MHGYLAEVDFGDGVEESHLPGGGFLQNLLGLPERLAMRFGWSGSGERVGKTLARLAGVAEPAVRWHLKHESLGLITTSPPLSFAAGKLH